MFVIPDKFAREMIALHGAKGADWLERLSTILASCERRWGITPGPAFADLSFHYVAPAVRSDGTAVVVKACSPTGEFMQEAEALRLFDGQGMVRLLEYDTSDEVMLLEHLEPGTLLRTVEDDEEATSIAATVMREFWRPAPQEHPFPTISDWGRGFARELGFDRARVRGWGLAQAVLSAWWSVEDFGDVSYTAIVCAKLLASTNRRRSPLHSCMGRNAAFLLGA